MTVVYVVLYNPNDIHNLKDIFATRESAEKRARELEEDEWLYPCEVIEWEVKE